ncbi:MauE/DoxX family redox-associated membrane protein [Flavobacterium terrisoli]|uniref:MauE/DoxX family redox-associated membrane protein n=1 Tax=Flavobacterium terrisoli TaxID=3242195 RepID=UPI002543E0D4|nr:MauE/DoxX family redox-associated membrane protein [Flavobacterium buctense]
MKLSLHLKTNIIYSISLLYILLFTYAAISKILDFENFQVQLGQSPLLSAYAESVSYAVPTIELVICCLLLIPRCRMIGLFTAYSLMVMFTAYIYIILNYSSFIPCSCGGILEDMSWNQHMLFNIAFIILSVIAVLLSEPGLKTIKYIMIGCGGLVSIGLIFALFYMSENLIHHHNNFTRRFPHFPAVLDKEMNLKADSYYFAGSNSGKIYLGNYTAPLQILEIDSTLQNKTIHKIKLNKMNLPFTTIQIKILGSYFYLVDGNVPCIFKGKTTDWKASYIMRGDPYFSQFVPVDSTKIAFRTILKKTKTNTLGLFDLTDTTSIKFEPKVIEKQIDGVFDTDGQVIYDAAFEKLVYIYTYRNQFSITDKNLKLLYRGNTIDTTAHANLKVVTISSSGETKLSAPPLTVNNTSAVFKNTLFVSSNLPGKYESLEMWKKAAIVDLYNLENRSYLLSFYIYNTDGKKMRSFYIEGAKLYALIGSKIVVYKLRKSVTENFK